MAKIVLIKNPTSDYEHVGDVIAIHDSKDVLGPSYDSFQIVEIEGTAEEVRKEIAKSIPERKMAYRSRANKNEWTFIPPEEKLLWNNNGEWEELERPKNAVRIESVEGLTLGNIKDKTSHNLASKGKVTVD